MLKQKNSAKKANVSLICSILGYFPTIKWAIRQPICNRLSCSIHQIVENCIENSEQIIGKGGPKNTFKHRIYKRDSEPVTDVLCGLSIIKDALK